MLLALGAGTRVQAQEQVDLDRPRAAPMKEIPGGRYTLGAEDGRPSARPEHEVEVEAFRIDVFEVPVAHFAAYLNSLDITIKGDAPAGELRPRHVGSRARALLFDRAAYRGSGTSRPPLVGLGDGDSRIGLRDGRFVVESGFGDHPVNEVTWYGARAYCGWRGARLPTEAEWEAAAGGMEDRKYPWGDRSPTPSRAVYGRRSNETAPVGSHPAGATPSGLHDMAGNVAEWTSSLFRPYPFEATDGREDPDAAGERVTRGGDHVFDSAPSELTTYFRDGFSRAVADGHRHIGIRCAADAR